VSFTIAAVLARTVILGFESRGTHDHILLSQIRDSPNLEGQVPVFISSRTRCPSYTPRYRVTFSPPPTTHRATVEVFAPASKPGVDVHSQLLYGWLLTANQFVLAPSHMNSQPEIFFQLNPCGRSPHVTSSLTRGCVCLLWIGFAWPLSSVRIAHMACYWKFFLYTIFKSFICPGFGKQTTPTYLSSATMAA
jgi:hypothetical protein